MNIPLDLINLQLPEATLSDSLSWLSSLTFVIILLLLTLRPNIELFQEVYSLCKHALSLKNILGHHKAREPFLWQFKGTQCLWRSVAPVILLLYTLIFRNLSPDSSSGCCSMLWNRCFKIWHYNNKTEFFATYPMLIHVFLFENYTTIYL